MFCGALFILATLLRAPRVPPLTLQQHVAAGEDACRAGKLDEAIAHFEHGLNTSNTHNATVRIAAPSRGSVAPGGGREAL